MSVFVVIVIIAHILLCLYSITYGAVFFIFLHQLLPPLARVGSISLNTVLIIVLFVTCFLNSIKTKRKLSLFPIIYLTIPLGIVCCFSEIPVMSQWKDLMQITIADLLPYTIIYASIRNNKELSMIINALLFGFIIIGLYGIITYFIHFNPLVLLFAYSFGFEGNMIQEDSIDMMRGALTGVATGNMPVALTWGQYVLVILLFILFKCKTIGSNYLTNIIIIICVLNCILTTKRSTITPALIALIYVAFTTVSVKKVIVRWGGLFVLVVFFCYWTVPSFKDIIKKNIFPAMVIWDDKMAENSETGGSNKEMRVEQWLYLNRVLLKNPITGEGLGYVKLYGDENTIHTPVKGFESIFLQVVAESGYLGLMIWLLFFGRCYNATNNYFSKHRDNCFFHGLYFLSLTLTGIKASLWIYMIICAIMERQSQLYKKIFIEGKEISCINE